MPPPRKPSPRGKNRPRSEAADGAGSAPSHVLDAWPGKNVLLAITGLSPAVLTETVWALSRLPVPVIPDSVVVLTTIEGRKRLKEQLFGEDDLWRTLRAEILGAGHEGDRRLDFDDSAACVKVFHRRTGKGREEMNDMNRLEDTGAVGDAIVTELWGWIRRPDHRVLASLSGGFKSMSALLYGAVSLLGRGHDRILHVLVDEPYDGRTEPFYYWPNQPQQSLVSTLKSNPGGFLAANGHPRLGGVEFAPLAELFDHYGFHAAPSFSELAYACRYNIELLRRKSPSLGHLVLIPDRLAIRVDKVEAKLPPVPFFLLLFLAESARAGIRHDGARHAAEAYAPVIDVLVKRPVGIKHKIALQKHRKSLKDGTRPADESRFNKTINALRERLGRFPQLLDRLEAANLDLKPDRITIE